MARRSRLLPLLAAGLATVLLGSATSAGAAQAAPAESVPDARRAAAQAAARVHDLRPRVDKALRAYDDALAGLAGAVTRSISAQEVAHEAAATTRRLEGETSDRVRALYISGGITSLVASVLSAPDGSDGLLRLAYVSRLVAAGTSAADVAEQDAAALAVRAERLEAAVHTEVATAGQVERRHRELTAVLAEASAELARLSDHARRLAGAAAREVATARAAEAAATARLATAQAALVPADYLQLYVAAALTCPGMSWSLLAAIGQVETQHGAVTAVSSAGAMGPMQFMPATFSAYGVDGDGDGDADILDPADSVFSAAHYLCANGAGRGGAALARAVWHYNHADWYVQLVLRLAGQLAARGAL